MAQRSELEGWSFVAVDTAIRLGAAFAEHAVRRWQPNLAKTTGRVAAALVSRAVATTDAPSGMREIRLWVMREARRLVVIVWDSDPTEPPARDAYLAAVTRAGLRWDWYHTHDGGTVVWVEVLTPFRVLSATTPPDD